jgi:patatin-like phospholipase/acyl hydrolase
MLAEDDKTIDASKTFSLITLDASRTRPDNLLEKGSSLEKTREKLAMKLISIFGGTAIGAFVFLFLLLVAVIFSNNTNKDTATPAKEKITTLLAPAKEIFTILLTTQATLVGSAVGFYFGERSSMKR